MARSDNSGRTLKDYPRPSVAVDTAVLTVPPDGDLAVLLVAREGDLRLPGTFLHEGELLAEAVQRSLRDKTGLTELDPQQLQVFDALDRDDRGRVLSVAHFAAVRAGALALAERVYLVPVAKARELSLPFDHSDIVALAVASLRARAEAEPDPFALLDEPFTMRELQRLHEAIAGAPLKRDAFRRCMESQLAETGAVARGGIGKPARQFVRNRAT